MQPDAVLLQRYSRDQDPEAFSELVRRHAQLVFATSYRITRNAEDAEDVSQECFMELARRAAAITASLPAWLHATARNRSINVIRGASRRRLREEEAVQRNDAQVEPGWEEIGREVDAALAELPEELREAILLHYFEGQGQTEIAEKLGVSQATVSRRLGSGVEALRSALKRTGVGVTVVALTAHLAKSASATVPASLPAALCKIGLAGVGASAATTSAATSSVAAAASASSGSSGGAGGVWTGIFGATKAKIIVVLAASALVLGGAIVHRYQKKEIAMKNQAEASVKREDGKGNRNMTTQIDMPAPAKESGNTYARAMSAVLSFLGTEISYDNVMGLTGVAFILQIDTGGPYINGELDCAWWPNDAWGFDLGLPVLSKAGGIELRKLRSNVDALTSDAAAKYPALAPAVEQSLAAGRPLLAEHDHCFIVTGIDGGEPPLLGYGTSGKSTQFKEEALRIPGYPWGLIVFGEKSAPGNPVEVDLASLRHIVALYNERAQGADAPKTRFSGRQAWAEWLRLLRDGSACDNNMLIHLGYNRRSAEAYLREMVKRHNGGAATHLSAAADLYQRIVDEAMKQGLPYNRVKNGEPEQTVRSEYTAMVERVSKMELQAITELEAAAASIAAKP